MRNLLTLLTCLTLSITAFSQDQKAKDILDKLSDKTAEYKSMEADFDYKMINTTEGINETQSGKLITKGDKYFLNIAGQKIFSNGELVWTLLEDAGEVQINVVPEESEREEDYISPSNILTLWEKGYKYKFDKESTLEGTPVNVINLYPEDADDKTYHTIKLFIDKTKNELKQIVIKGKDGTDFTYVIKKFQTNNVVDDNKFTFNKTEYPGIDIIDLR